MNAYVCPTLYQFYLLLGRPYRSRMVRIRLCAAGLAGPSSLRSAYTLCRESGGLVGMESSCRFHSQGISDDISASRPFDSDVGPFGLAL